LALRCDLAFATTGMATKDILFTSAPFHSPICGEWKEMVSISVAK
jgi:hypothetical protein